MGATNSGKTTLKNVLVDPRHQPAATLKLCNSEAQEPTCTECELNGRKLRIVDVPGGMIQRTHDLCKINEVCHKKFHVIEFHLVCFCAAMTHGISERDIKLFERIVEHFGRDEICGHLCLIVTRCESISVVSQARIREEIKHDAHFTKIRQILGDKIYFSGALNPDHLNRVDEGPLLDQFDSIYRCRQTLLKFINEECGNDPFVMQLTCPMEKNSR